MYPAQALADGLYTADDLPDAITGGGGTNFTRSGTTFLGPPNSYDVVLDINESGFAQWASATNYANLPFFDVGFIGQECTSNCLITPEQDLGQFCYSYEDQFADTYTVTINPPDDNAGTYTVTRRSNCTWSTQVEESGEPAGLKLSYIDAVIVGGFAYTWEIELDTSYIKDGFANTPTGDYSGGKATVS